MLQDIARKELHIGPGERALLNAARANGGRTLGVVQIYIGRNVDDKFKGQI
jgi:hypothetical protein